MTNWTTTVTNKGIALQSKQVRGATLSFTRVVGGSGSVSLVLLKEQTAVSDIKQTISIESIRVLDAKYTITVLLSNSNSNSGYNLSQIGFYATDPDEGEILFAIAQADTAEFIPSKDEAEGFCLEFAFTFQNSNNSTIEITPDPAGYMSREGVDDVVFEAQKNLTISGKESGNPITINDSTDAPLADIVVYGASEQTTTKGYQLFDASKISTTSKGGATVTNNGDGSFIVSGSGTLSEAFSTSIIIPHEDVIKLLRPGTLYFKSTRTRPYLSVQLRDTSTSTNVAELTHFNGSAEITQEILDNENFIIVIQFFSDANSEIITGTIFPMLYQDGDGTFEPYTGGKPGPNPDYPLEIESVGDSGSIVIDSYGKNLLKCLEKEQTFNGITYTPIADGGISANGTATSSAALVLEYRKAILGKYVLSGSSKNTRVVARVVFYDGTSIYHTSYNGSVVSFEITEDVREYNVYVEVKGDITVSNEKFYPMLRIDGTDDIYEPYKKHSVIIPLTDSMRGIPVSSGGNYTDASGQQWICDEIDLARGVYVQNCFKETLTFTLQEDLDRYSAILTYNANTMFADGTGIPVLCDKLKYDANSGSGSPMTNGIRVSSASPKYAIAYHNGEVIDSATVIYPLAEPIETPLTDEQILALQSLQTFEPTTNIFSSELANVDVEYYKNTDNGRAIGKIKQENVELRALIGDINSILESVIGGA